MEKDKLIPVADFCIHHQVEISFIQSLEETGLITTTTYGHRQYIGTDALSLVEKMLRLNKELSIHPDDLDIIVHLLDQVETLQGELRKLRDKVRFYEDLL